jgi:lysophospholipase L1-like esterase
MKPIHLFIALLSLAACQRPNYTATAPAFEPDYALDRFESTIKNYEKQDSTQMPAVGGIVLAGSSSFYFWKNAEKDLSPLPIINRGFGGSTLPEVSYYVERTILKYKPKTVVIYCENDMYGSKAKTPAQTRDAYVRLTQQIRSKLPQAQIYFVGLKPSPSRWNRWKEATEANNMIQDFIKTDKKHGYIDVSATMLAANGRPDGGIFLKDSLHMNLEGYRRWTAVIKPILGK